MQSWAQYATFSMNLFNITLNTKMGKESIDESGVLSFWVLSSLKVAESHGDVTLDDRLASLTFLAAIWQHKSTFVEQSIAGAGNAILNILKRGARDVR